MSKKPIKLSAQGTNHGVLDCSAILLSLFMNQSKTASNIMFMLDLGNHLDQWSLKKTATDLEQSLLAKESDVFLVQGDMSLVSRVPMFK